MHRRTLILTATASALAARGALAQDARVEGALRMRDLYEKDLSFSPLAEELAGRRVTIEGFMAPPLQADTDWFVLTKRPMAVCPFCESEAEWPDDILAVHTKRKLEPVSFNRRIEVRGVLELGAETDTATGFVSRVRLTDASYESAT